MVTRHRPLALLAVTGSLIGGFAPAADAKRRAHLTSFPSCSGFVRYARAHAARELRTMGSPGVRPVFTPETKRVGAAPPAASVPQSTSGATPNDYSGTNVQEAGVDEPDTVKTDGKTIFTVQNGTLFAIDARSDAPKLLGSVVVDGYDLLLDGDRLLVLGGSNFNIYTDVIAPGVRAAAAPRMPIYQPPSSTLTEVDVSNPSAMRVVKTMSVDGSYVSARLNGHSARVVLSAYPRAIPMLVAAATPARKRAISRTTTPSWRPSYRLRSGRKGRATTHALVRCTAIARPAEFSGLNSLTVLTIDLRKGLEPVDSDAIMTDGQIVYGSANSLYVATQKAIVEQPDATKPPPNLFTEIHKFDISKPGQTTYVGSGVVSGTLLNQFSMSENNGYLRVASTDSPLWWAQGANRPSQSYVTVLGEKDGALSEVGRVGGLGRGERIYAVRMIGDVGYVVTFRQVDPLFTIGLSDPAHPRVLGSLDLLGYSAYLHPVGDGLLLGVGQAANEQGRTEGTQLQLFDVSDPANPTRIAQRRLGNGSSSSVEFDHHAFLWWDPIKLAVLPLQVYDYDPQKGKPSGFSGAVGFHVTRADGISETGRVAHPAQDSGGYQPPIDRTVVVGDRLFSISYAGVMASDLATFADRGFAAFPQPPPQAAPGSPPSKGQATPPPK